MSYTVSKYPAGTFSWADLMSTDIDKSKRFLVELMDWTAEDMPTQQGPKYTMFKKNGKSVAGMAPVSPDMKGHPSAWNCYVTVESVDETVIKVEKNGGKLAMLAMNVMDAGRMAGITDPTGASLMIWEPKKHIGAELVNTVGAMGWNELYTTDVNKSQEFYSQVFGWDYDSDNYVIRNNKRMNGGIMAIQKEWGDIPPHWAVYFTVADIEKSVEKAKELGGSVRGEIREAGDVGRFAVVAEPTGATFILIELKNEPDHWIE